LTKLILQVAWIVFLRQSGVTPLPSPSLFGITFSIAGVSFSFHHHFQYMNTFLVKRMRFLPKSKYGKHTLEKEQAAISEE
jgi:hypothetical protein